MVPISRIRIEETKRVSKIRLIDAEVDKHTENAFILHIAPVSLNQVDEPGFTQTEETENKG